VSTVPGYAQVLIDSEAVALDRRFFTYAIPEALLPVVQIGSPVLVPFGRQPAVTGFVVALTHQVEGHYTVKAIAEVLDEQPLFTLDYLGFLDEVAQNDGCTLQQVIQAALPSGLLQKLRKEVHLNNPSPKALEALARENRSLGGRLQQLLAKRLTPVTPKYLATQLKVPLKQLTPVLYQMRDKGIVAFQTVLKDAPQPRQEIYFQWVAPSASDSPLTLTPRQQLVVNYCRQYPPMTSFSQRALQTETGVSLSVLQKLVSAGVLKRFQQTVYRNPLQSEAFSAVGKQLSEPLVLNNDQQAVVTTILAADNPLSAGHGFLLHGVTGSGKTEVYLSLAKQLLANGRSVMVLLPEIALTTQITQRLVRRLGIDNVAIWHSNLSDGEKADAWRRMVNGEIRLVIGARSAIFAPLPQLGLIIIDEAHDNSFKQDAPAPRYQTKALAYERARRHGALVVLGTATPDIVDYEQARFGETTTGLPMTLLTLHQRYGNKTLASVETVDMREERQQGNSGILSRELKTALTANWQAGQQSLVLINRRGYYTLLQCRDCNHVFRCPHCDVSLTHHQDANQARCHHCGYAQAMPQYCPTCAGMSLLQAGVGTQRVEAEIQQLMPEARVVRLDRDVTQRKMASQTVLNQFSSGEADILIGTQMVAKGLDMPNVTLVGVINADSSFYLPDYRSAERGFQLLTQVAGRAGRGEKPGRVLLQTTDPNHPVIHFARQQDFLSFYAYERENRQAMQFPPFSQLYRFIVSGVQEVAVQQLTAALTQQLQQQLQQAISQDQALILGPSPCGVARLHGKYRYHCLVKVTADTANATTLHRMLVDFYRRITPTAAVSVILDVDSQSLL